MPISKGRRWWLDVYYRSPWGLTVGLGLLVCALISRSVHVWARAGLDLGAWSAAFDTWLGSSEVLAFIIGFFLLAVYDRFCLLNAQLHELVSLKAFLCEDKDGGLTEQFLAFLAARGLGPLGAQSVSPRSPEGGSP